MNDTQNYPASRGRPGSSLAWLTWTAVAVVLAVWGLLLTASDDWWPATVLLFLPRWIWGVPLAVLALGALVLRPRLLGVLLVGAVVVLWPIMGLCLPWQRLFSAAPATFRCRVLTCNVHRTPFGIEAVVNDTRPDIVALQDWPEHFTPPGFQDGKWHVRTVGQFCLASRFPIRELTPLEPPTGPANTVVRARLETPAGMVRFYNLHLATPRQALVAIRQRGWNGAADLESNSEIRRYQSEVIATWMAEEHGPLLAAGDFNTPADSNIYRLYWSGYANAFAEAGLGWGYTFHTNRTALRIDHILAGPGWRYGACWVGPDVGSEHRPVIADVEWLGAGK